MLLWSNILSFVEQVFKVLAPIASWNHPKEIYPTSNQNKLRLTVGYNTWVAFSNIYAAGYDSLFEAVLSNA